MSELNLYEQEFAEAWRAFNRLPRVADSRQQLFEWTRERQVLAFVLPVQAYFPAVAEAVGPLQEELAAVRGVEVVPPENLHVTVQLAGTLGADDTTWAEVERLSLEAGDVIRVRPPFRMVFGQPNAFADAVILEVYDGGSIRRIRERLRAVWPRILQNGAERFFSGGEDRWLPHMSLAYFDGAADPSEVALLLERRRGKDLEEVRVDHLELVMQALLPEVHFPPLETITRWELSGSDRQPMSLADIRALRTRVKSEE